MNNDDKKVRQSACESLESEGVRLTVDDLDVLKKAVQKMQDVSSNDKDRGVRRKASSAYDALSAHQQKLEKPATPSWGSTASDEPKSSTSGSQRQEGEPNPALEYILAETLNGTLSLTGELQSESIETTGVMKVKNLSSSEKVFDVNFTLEEKGLSSLEDEYHFNEIQPDEEQIVEYNVNIEKVDDLAIEFKERIDTFPESGREEGSNVLVFGQTMDTKLKYNFTAKKTIKTFTLTKELPTGFDNVQIEEKSLGDTQVDGNKVTWVLNDVQEGTSGSLVLKGSFKVDNLDDISTGIASVEFTSETDTHSGLKLAEAKEGRVSSKNFIDSDEVSEEPDNWNNKFVFENPSDIDVTLKYVKITNPSDNDSEVVNLDQPVLVSSKGTWESEQFKTFSETQPSFLVDFDLMVGSKLTVDTTSKLEVEQGALRVANITATKAYELDQVPSYRETPLPANVNIENIGAIAYAKLTIADKVPMQFLPPVKDDMVLKLVTDEGEEVLNVDSDYEYTVDGNAEDAESEKNVLITVNKEVPPGAKVIWEYAQRAFKPLPDHTYDFNTHIEATLTEEAPPLPFDLPEDLTITVVHQRRNVTVGKTIMPGSNKNHYEVELFYKNRGTATLNDLEIKDFIPDSFEFVTESVEFTTEDPDARDNEYDQIKGEEQEVPSGDYEGKMKVWKFPVVKPNDKLNIHYTISGSGEFSMKKAQLTFT